MAVLSCLHVNQSTNQSAYQSNSESVTQPTSQPISVTLTELEYDESVSACTSRYRRGVPLLMNMSHALKLMIDHKSVSQSTSQSPSQCRASFASSHLYSSSPIDRRYAQSNRIPCYWPQWGNLEEGKLQKWRLIGLSDPRQSVSRLLYVLRNARLLQHRVVMQLLWAHPLHLC